MEINNYLKAEGINRIKTSSELDNIIIDSIGKEKFDEYEKIGDNFVSLNNIRNIKEFYNFIIENKLDEYFQGILLNRTQEEVPLINTLLDGYKRILDVGCNTGLKTVYYAVNHLESEFIGIDVADKALNSAIQRTKKYDSKNINYTITNMIKLGFKESFDCVLIDHSLHETTFYNYLQHYYEPNFGYKLKNLNKIMKKGGRLITVLTPANIEYFIDEFPYIENSSGFKHKKMIEVNYEKFEETETDLIFIAEKK